MVTESQDCHDRLHYFQDNYMEKGWINKNQTATKKDEEEEEEEVDNNNVFKNGDDWTTTGALVPSRKLGGVSPRPLHYSWWPKTFWLPTDSRRLKKIEQRILSSTFVAAIIMKKTTNDWKRKDLTENTTAVRRQYGDIIFIAGSPTTDQN